MPPSNVTLTFFDGRGRGEAIRWLLAYGGANFKDERLGLAEWQAKKPMKGPFGQMPYIELDGKILAQTTAIGRYLAREFGLAGANNWESALADMYVDGGSDLHTNYGPVATARVMENDEAKAMSIWANFKTNQLKDFMERYTKFLEANNTGWLVGNNLTWADIVIAEILNRFKECFDPNVLDDYPKMKALHDKVVNLPAISKYIASRPHATF